MHKVKINERCRISFIYWPKLSDCRGGPEPLNRNWKSVIILCSLTTVSVYAWYLCSCDRRRLQLSLCLNLRKTMALRPLFWYIKKKSQKITYFF